MLVRVVLPFTVHCEFMTRLGGRSPAHPHFFFETAVAGRRSPLTVTMGDRGVAGAVATAT